MLQIKLIRFSIMYIWTIKFHLKSSKLNILHNDHSADKEAGLGGVAIEPQEKI